MGIEYIKGLDNKIINAGISDRRSERKRIMIKSVSQNNFVKLTHVMYESGRTRYVPFGQEPESVKKFMRSGTKIKLNDIVTVYRKGE